MKTPLKTNAASESNPPVAVVGRPPVTFPKAVQMAALCRDAATTLLLACTLAAAAQTNQYGRISETDGQPTDLGNGQVAWTYAVQNASSGNMTAVRFENVFSTTPPVAGSLPNGWTLVSSPTTPTNSWSIVASADSPLDYLPPGDNAGFTFITTFGHPTRTLLTGPRPGAVMFNGNPGFWYSPDVTGLIGPVGENPTGTPTLALGVTLFDGEDYDAGRPGLQWALRYAFTNTSPNGLGTGGAPFGLVALNLPAGTNAGVYLAQPALGCAAWPVALADGTVALDGAAQPLAVGGAGELTLYFEAGPLTTNGVSGQTTGYVPGGPLPLAPLSAPVPGVPPANPYGRIWETDGVPEEWQEDGIRYFVWNYTVLNTGMGNMSQVRFSNVFSTTEPLFDTAGLGWVMSTTPGSSDYLWEVTFSGSYQHMPPGGRNYLSFVTTHTYPTHRLLTGPRPGAVMFQGYPGDWFTPDITGLVGPVGEVPTNAAPVLPGLASLALGVPGVSVTATNLAWGYGYTLERSADLEAWTNLLTFAATNATHLLHFPPPPNAPQQFYRLRSP